MLIGVCNVRDQKVCINPDDTDTGKFASKEEFFNYYNVGIIIAEEEAMATAIGNATSDDTYVDKIVAMMVNEEHQFSIRAGMSQGKHKRRRHDHGRSRTSITLKSIQNRKFSRNRWCWWGRGFQLFNTDAVPLVPTMTIEDLIDCVESFDAADTAARAEGRRK